MRRVTSVAVAVLLATIPVGGNQGQQPSFRSGIDLVAVDVSVHIRNQPLPGLKAEDFELLDNGVLQEIVDVTRGSLPIDITLAIDLSFSTSEFAKNLRAAVKDQMSRFEKGDRLRLILYNSRTPVATEFTADVKVIDRALGEIKAGGETTVVDAASEALAAATPAGRRHLVIFVTDGAFSSGMKPDVLVDIARRTRATASLILPIQLPANKGPVRITKTTPSPTQRERSDPLSAIAMETGGVIIWTTSTDASRALRTLINDFRASYVLHFAPRGVDAGGVHTLVVRVKRPDARVKARRTYVR